MKPSCEIIKDLFPLYLDMVCSNDSKVAVELHIAECENCKAELQVMQASLPLGAMAQNLKEAEAVKNLSKRWKKGMYKSLLKGIFIAILAVSVLALVLYVFVGIQIVY